MDTVERERLVARYKEGYRVVTDALVGITDVQLDARKAPGEWSPRQVIHHLADSETTSAVRLRRLLAEEHPVIQGYDQDEFARVLRYDRPIDAALALFGAVRASTAELLDRMTDADWARQGTHSESGPYGVEDWLRIYAGHAHDHANQIRRAREAAP
ncbi:MAG: DinB family protein [Chloroflexota bacterium]|nr:DinB family protein [Chloroflexota bacterium]